MKAVAIENLSYTIGNKTILNNINFNLAPGERIALLGSNGSGKSTLIDLISQNLKPSQGAIDVLGSSFKKRRHRIGLLYDNTPYFNILKVKELIAFAQSAYGLSKKDFLVEHLSEVMGIKDIENNFFYSLSKGERKKVGIILSLIHGPDLLIADEPTSFLDPLTRNAYWKLLREQKQLSILFTTHLWDEAQRYADKIIFINEGVQLKSEDTVSSLLSSKYLPGETKIVTENDSTLGGSLQDATIISYNEQQHIFSTDIKRTLGTIQQSISSYSLLEKNLEDVYQYLILKRTV